MVRPAAVAMDSGAFPSTSTWAAVRNPIGFAAPASRREQRASAFGDPVWTSPTRSGSCSAVALPAAFALAAGRERPRRRRDGRTLFTS